jgi:hypothetical protein
MTAAPPSPDEADEALARLGPDDIGFLIEHYAKNDVAPVYREALKRYLENTPGWGGGSKSHRRGRRG